MEWLCFFVVVVFTVSAFNVFSVVTSNQNAFCMTKSCIQTSALLLENIDNSVDPCDDFYSFACGNFVKKSEEETLENGFSYQNTVFHQLKTIYEEPILVQDPHFLKLLKNMYKSCMNTDQIEESGLFYLKKIIKDLGGWPTFEPEWNEKNFDWVNTLDQIRRIGWQIDPIFNIVVETDKKNSSRHILTINPGSTWDPWLQKELNNTKVTAKLQFFIEILTLFGADRITATSDMKNVLQLAIDLSKFSSSLDKRENKSVSYNIVTLQEFQRQHPNLPWFAIINNFADPAKKFNPDDVINVDEPTFFKKLDKFLPTVKKRTLANYIFTKLLRNSIDYLPKVFRDKENDYLEVVGQNQKIRWKTCVENSLNLNIAVSSIYVKKFFDFDIRSEVSEMANNIKEAVIDNLNKNDWIDLKTKKRAISKAKNIAFIVGYLDVILNENKVDEVYRNLTLDGTDYYLKIFFNISKYNHEKMVTTLTEKAVWRDWKNVAKFYEVNAFYNQQLNIFEITGAILSSPIFYQSERPCYMNYGGIGTVIGHEITHGFDNHGRQYDKDGLLFDWWEPETEKKFVEKSECLVEQYGNFTIPEIGRNLNGQQTLAENIADNGGIKIAYNAYLKGLQKDKQEPLLPGLPYNQKQLFWISYANLWCTKYSNAALEEQVLGDVHSPARFRATGTLRNSKAFAKDFGCALGSKMNPVHKCQVW